MRVTKPAPEQDNVEWSLYITIYFGFSLMFIALMYFEWRTIFKCINRCKDRLCGKSSQRQIGFVDEPGQGELGK